MSMGSLIVLTIYSLKSRFQNILRPIVILLVKKNVTANFITILAMILSIFYGIILFAYYHVNFVWIFLPFIFFVRMVLNAIDGMLAREFNQKSNLGAVLNEMGDVISDIALFLPFAFLSSANLWPVVVFCVLAVMSEMMGVVAIQIGSNRRYDGPMGKSDRVFVLGFTALSIGCGWISTTWCPWIFSALSLLVILTILNRGFQALKG